MKITFRLRFFTRPGQFLFLLGDHPVVGGGSSAGKISLHYLNPEFWQAVVEVPDEAIPNEPLSYSYYLQDADGSVIQDWGEGRRLKLKKFQTPFLTIVDSWNDAGAVENVFYTEPFKNVLLRRDNSSSADTVPKIANYTLQIKAPLLRDDEVVCVVGNCAEMGNWNAAHARLMQKAAGEDSWHTRFDLGSRASGIEYKYGIWNTAEKKFVCFEAGENRIIPRDLPTNQIVVMDDGFMRLPADTWKGAGVAIPVFSLRSENGFGVGEFPDIKKLVDWAKVVGLKLIQLLPINDTNATNTWRDSYPYAAISAFALHPIYLNLESLAADKKITLSAAQKKEQQRLNALPAVDYEAVLKAKLDFIKKIFTEEGEAGLSKTDFKAYFAQNQHWLTPYAAFCVLKDRFKTANFNQWPAHNTYKAGEIDTLGKKDAEFLAELRLHYFIQYQLHLQLKAAADYAHANGIIIKGDIAIGVHRHGADVWQQPELFFTDKQAGAPPDPFDAKGQNWGFPTYNWPRMLENNLLWWRQRFSQMSRYFDAFRIDHILGFFRIWSNPADAIEGILGIFVPALPVKVDEFAEREIPFDRDRYVKPFINDQILSELFGAETDQVKKQFLEKASGDRWHLQAAFASQLKVENHFSGKTGEREKTIRQGLFDLISNVILFEVENASGLEFHFRYGMIETSSFKTLDFATREKLRALYVDYFFRRQETLWKQMGMQKLPALKRATNMLICGEDLGMVPDCVPVVMKQLGLLSLEIQRMPKTLNTEFSRPADAPYLSVVTPSTHDMSTIRGWWEEDANLSQKFFNQELKLAGDAPKICSAKINQRVIEQHLQSPAIWSIFQLQDLLGMDEKVCRENIADERINVPANTKHYWRYRMHLTLEQLQAEENFNRNLSSLMKESRRD